MIDTHCHILPGVDDGCRSIEESISLLIQAASEGVTAVICTPHYTKRYGHVRSWGANLVTMQHLQERLNELGIGIKLYLGNEVFTCVEVGDLLKSKLIGSMNQSRYVLVEFDVMKDSSDIDEMLYNLMVNGYLPIIAHLERYEYLVNQSERLEQWLSMGCRFQVNAISIEHPSPWVKKLLKHGMVHLVASDAHHHLRPMHLSGAYQCLKKQYGEGIARQLLVVNPGRIIAHQVIDDKHRVMKNSWL
jgi:protein-tyrosine phosphatase